uniref:Uncharacterized protein n=1 Tax=Arundo donax TaxID=35708 RepID=A0A0A9ESC4_ARUDO
MLPKYYMIGCGPAIPSVFTLMKVNKETELTILSAVMQRREE